jgi:hypothetical protein
MLNVVFLLCWVSISWMLLGNMSLCWMMLCCVIMLNAVILCLVILNVVILSVMAIVTQNIHIQPNLTRGLAQTPLFNFRERVHSTKSHGGHKNRCKFEIRRQYFTKILTIILRSLLGQKERYHKTNHGPHSQQFIFFVTYEWAQPNKLKCYITLGWKSLLMTNTLAYCTHS